MGKAKIGKIFYCCAVFLLLLVFSSITSAWAATCYLTSAPVSAFNDTECAGTHVNKNLICTAKEFVVGTTFSAAPDTPPFCVAGNPNFNFQVDLNLSDNNNNRYDISFYTGQTYNDPSLNNSGLYCSTNTFPTSIGSVACAGGIGTNAFSNLDLNGCEDFTKVVGNVVEMRINQIKALCMGDASGYLSIPYLLAWNQLSGDTPGCTQNDPTTYPIYTGSKCQTGSSSVSGTVKVFSGAYVDVTKHTVPSGDTTTPFSFTAKGPSGSSIAALTNSTTLGLGQPTDGDYTPKPAVQGNGYPTGVSITLKDGKTARFYINALSTPQTLTMTEDLYDANWWESTVTGSCTGTGTSFTGSTRTMTASLSTTNSAATCSITNYKRAQIKLNKNITRINNADEFTISASRSGGSALTGTTSATTAFPGTSATMTFYSSGNSSLYASPSVTLTDAKTVGPNPLSSYLSTLTCTNATPGSPTLLPIGVITTSYTIYPNPNDNITCTYTNIPKPVAPTIAKSFTPASIALSGTSTMRFVVTNPNIVSSLSGIAFSDTLPAGITAANGTTTVCGGSLQITGGNTIAFTGGTLAVSGTCNIDVTVTGAAVGAQSNTTSVISSTESGSGTTSNTATLNVYAVPTVTKTFTPPTIASGGTSSMVITVTNPGSNPGNLTGVSISDSYGGTITNNASGSVVCSDAGSATLTGGVNGGTTVGFTSGTIVPGGTCTISQSVTATSTSNNTTGTPGATGPVALTGAVAGPVTLTVGVAVLTILKSAVPSSVNPGGIITYTIVVTNTSAGSATSATVTDAVPTYTTYVANSTRLNGITVAGDGATLPLIVGLLIDDNASRTPGAAATGILPVGKSATITFQVTVN